MPSNKELTTEAKALAEELGLPITTEGLNNQALAALVSDLKAKKRDADTATPADVAPTSEDFEDFEDLEDLDEEDMVTQPVATKKGSVIAPGKCLTSLKGILSEGMPVTPEHFPGGQETFDNLKKRGFIE